MIPVAKAAVWAEENGLVCVKLQIGDETRVGAKVLRQIREFPVNVPKGEQSGFILS